MVANGGTGGGGGTATSSANASGNTPGLGGVASGGDLNFEGSEGNFGLLQSGVMRISAFTGESIFGGRKRTSTSSGNGRAVSGYGVGGCGATVEGVATNYAGADGSQGIIIIEEYF